MKIAIGRLLAGAVLTVLAYPSLARSEQITLECRNVSQPEYVLSQLYKYPPKTTELFLEDAIEAGHAGDLLPKPNRWLIDTDGQTFASVGGAPEVSLTGLVVDGSLIGAMSVGKTGNAVAVLFDKASGVLNIETVTNDQSGLGWIYAHGGQWPAVLVWTQQCSTASKS